MERNVWYVCSQVAERIDDAPVLKEYIKSKVSEPPDELFFFDSVYLDNYRITLPEANMIGSRVTTDAPREQKQLGAFGKMSGLSSRLFLSFPVPPPCH